MKIFMLTYRSFVGFVWEQRRGWKRSIFKLGRGFVHCRIGSHGRFYGKLRNVFYPYQSKQVHLYHSCGRCGVFRQLRGYWLYLCNRNRNRLRYGLCRTKQERHLYQQWSYAFHLPERKFLHDLSLRQ